MAPTLRPAPVPSDGRDIGQRGQLVDHHADPPGVVGGVVPVVAEHLRQRFGGVPQQAGAQLGQQLALALHLDDPVVGARIT